MMNSKSLLFSFITLFSLSYAMGQIDVTEAVTIGNIKQQISITADDADSPVLLYLHGGPGESVMGKADAYTGELKEHFVLVHWDQRGAGETLKLNDTKVDMKLMKSDAEEMLQYLLKRFNKERIYLVGHSWGTVLGFHLAKNHPEQVAAFIAVSPLINSLESQRIALDMLKHYFAKTDNQKAIEQLETVSVPYENLEQRIIQYRWQKEFDGETVTDEQVEQAIPYLRQWEEKWGEVEKEVGKINMEKETLEFKCPIFFFIGQQDYQTNFNVAKQYFQVLKAPLKDLFWFERSGHNVPNSEPDVFQETIIDDVLSKTEDYYEQDNQ